MVRILGRGGGTAEAESTAGERYTGAAAAGGAEAEALPPLSIGHQRAENIRSDSSTSHRQTYIHSQAYNPPNTEQASYYPASGLPPPNPAPAPTYTYPYNGHPYYGDPYNAHPYNGQPASSQQMGRDQIVMEEEQRKTHWYQRIPVLTIAVVLACIIVFVVTMAVNNCPSNVHPLGATCLFPWLGRFAFEPIKVNPMLGPSASTLLDMGATNSVYVLDYHQTWRLLTVMWLHAGVIHIASNMIGVYFLGAPMEREFGMIKFALVYLLSGISGAIFSTLFLGNSISVGASGALFGLVGATLSELIINWNLYSNRVCALFSLLILIAINLAIGLMPYIDNFAHIGGCCAGILLGFALLVKPQRGYIDLKRRDNVAAAAAAAEAGGVVSSSRNTVCQNVTRVIAAITFLALFFAGLGLVLSGTHTNCSWCHYLSCVPTSLWQCNNSQSPSLGDGPVCQETLYKNGTGVITCANSTSTAFPNLTGYTDYQLRVLCSTTCS